MEFVYKFFEKNRKANLKAKIILNETVHINKTFRVDIRNINEVVFGCIKDFILITSYYQKHCNAFI